MEQPSHISKISILYSLLFELLAGRSPVFPQAGEAADPYDGLLASFSGLARQLQELLREQRLLPPLYQPQPVAPFVLVLDAAGRITLCTPVVGRRLGYPKADLVGRVFAELLVDTSPRQWSDILAGAGQEEQRLLPAELLMRTASDLRLPLSCWIVPDLGGEQYFVVAVGLTLHLGPPLRDGSHTQASPQEAAVNLARDLHGYIIRHLDTPLPPARELARRFGTDEFCLRKAFRQSYGMSPYQCYQEARLDKALQLIKHTGLSLQEVAFSCGFDLYGNFYRAFRKRYGCPPSSVSREG